MPKRIPVTTEAAAAKTDVELHVILNWDEELNRLVPAASH